MSIFKCQEFAYGSHTFTPTQVKKHFIQMNDYERQLVTKAVKNINLRRIVISPLFIFLNYIISIFLYNVNKILKYF